MGPKQNEPRKATCLFFRHDQGWKNYLFLLWLQLQIQLQPKTFNYNYNYSSQVIVTQFQLQLQWKDSQNIATNSLTYEASSFAYVNTVDLFCISIPDLSSPISLYPCASINLCLPLIFAIHNFVYKQLSSMLLHSYRFQQHYGFS